MSEKISRDLRRISQLCAAGDRETHRAVFHDLAEIVGALAETTFWSSVPRGTQRHLRDFCGKAVTALSDASADAVGLYLRLTSGALNRVADLYDEWRSPEELAHALRCVGNLLFFGKSVEQALEDTQRLVEDLGKYWRRDFPEGLQCRLFSAYRLAEDACASGETPGRLILMDMGEALNSAADHIALSLRAPRTPDDTP
ncbi:hypothetical protein [Streptomyces buecherae]|uniref:hypothetical protein n=1 Tax=Streptomyces buecherae TaxID=2763006 RepID=UPI0037B73FBF